MDFNALYQSKLTTPAAAVGRIASGEKLSMGMAVSEPPALLRALHRACFHCRVHTAS